MLTSVALTIALGIGSITGTPQIRFTDMGPFANITDPITCVQGRIEVTVTTDNASDYVCGFIIRTDPSGLPQMMPAINTQSGTTWTLLWTDYDLVEDGQILRIECHTQTPSVETLDYTLNVGPRPLPGSNVVKAKAVYPRKVKDEEKIKITQTTTPVGGGTVSSDGGNKGLHHVGYLLKLDANGRPTGVPLKGVSKNPPMGKSWRIDFENVPNPGAGKTDLYLQVIRSRNKENASIETKKIEVKGN